MPADRTEKENTLSGSPFLYSKSMLSSALILEEYVWACPMFAFPKE